ncbi:MAG: glycosyltransferase family 4 protein [Dermatophilaceae bacterium]
MPVRVAMLSDCYAPRLGGIENQVRDLSRRLVAAGHHVEVFTATQGAHGERGGVIHADDGVLVHRLGLRLPYGVPVNPFAPPEVRRRLVAGGFDVAHAHLGVVSPFATDLVPVALDAGLPVLATFHCVLDRAAPAMRALGRWSRWAARGVAFDAVSSWTAAEVSGVARGARVEVLGNGIDAAWWRDGASGERDRTAAGGGPGDRPPVPTLPRQRIAADDVHVTTAIRLVSRKRPLRTLAVLRRARALLPERVRLRATIVGAGPQRAAMAGYLRRYGMGWVSLPGRVGRGDIRRLHHSADLYLSLALAESFGIATLEAHAAGVPVIARAGTGVADFLTDGADAVLSPTDDGVAAALAALAADSGARSRMRAHLLGSSVRYDWSTVLLDTLAEYRRAGAPAC